MKLLRYILIILVVGLIVIQFFPTMENKSDLVPATDLIQSREVPSQVATLLHNACYDCHSNNTNYPWYDKIQPFAWFLEGHIIDAKRGLNFNEFETYTPKKQQKKLKGIRFVMEKDVMPLDSYKLMHAESRLSKEERQAIINWVDDELKNYQ